VLGDHLRRDVDPLDAVADAAGRVRETTDAFAEAFRAAAEA
jgi:DNA-directed RNA polymerase subunit L